MTDKDLSQIYQQVVIEHSQHPHNFREIEQSTHRAKGYNRVCGDALTVFLQVDDERILDAAFQGDCCAVCKCSVSLLTEQVKGMTVEAFTQMLDNFEGLLHQRQLSDQQRATLGRLTVFEGIWEFPARLPCANLGWHTLQAALKNKTEVSTE